MRSQGVRNDENTASWWHRGLVTFPAFANIGQLFHSAPAQAHSLAGHGYTLAFHTHALAAGGTVGLGGLGGGGGLGSVLVHLLIWRLIWRVGLGLWHIPTVGPFVVLLLIAVIVALAI